MVIVQQLESLQTNSASTSDWIEQVKGCVIYAYDLGTLVFEGAGIVQYTKDDFEQALKGVSRKRNMPVGEHIREAIQIIKGNKD